MVVTSENGISDAELAEAIRRSVEGKQPKKVLLLPPDHTRLYSGAGKICSLYYNYFKDICPVDVMPALGT